MGGHYEAVLIVYKCSDGTYRCENPQEGMIDYFAEDPSLQRLLSRLASKKYVRKMRTLGEIYAH